VRCLPALRHVFDQGQKIFRFSVIARNWNLGRGNHADAIRRRERVVGEVERPTAVKAFLVHLCNKVGAILGIYIIRCFPNHLFAFKSEQLLTGFVDDCDASFLDGLDHDWQRDVIDHRIEKFFRAAKVALD
jgi:hypothetical protein